MIDHLKLDNPINLIENSNKKELIATRKFGNVKRANWEVHNPIRNYIFKKPKYSSTVIIKILF